MEEEGLLPGVADAQLSRDMVRWLADFQTALRELNIENATFLAQFSLKDAGYHALLLIRVHGAESGLNVSDLAERLVSKSSSTSELVDRLVRQGWIVRDSLQSDRRQAMLSLTDEGRRVIDRALDAHAGQLKGSRQKILSLILALQMDFNQIVGHEENR